MHTIDTVSLPELSFAHIFSAKAYTNHFAPRENFIEVTYISEGSLLLERDGQQLTAKTGDIICQFFDKPVAIRSAAFHSHHTVGIQLRWQPEEKRTSGLYLPLLTPAELGTGKIQSIINLLIEEQFSYQSCRAKCAAKVFDLLCAIDSCNRKAKQVPLPSQQLYAQRAKDYIHKNIHAPITQKEVAAHLSISPEYLCAVFKQSEGITLIRYCNQLKLRKIQELMELEKLSLREAAALFGYSDPNYVSALFKKYHGCSVTKSILSIKHAP